MSKGNIYFIVRRIENHYLFLFPDIPYWFTVDSKEKREFIEQLFRTIHLQEDVDKGIQQFKLENPITEDFENLITMLKKAGIFDLRSQGQPPTPVPNLPRIAQVSVEVTKACNLTCQHCSVDAGIPREHELKI